jgi:UDP-N-acetylglucosamine 2-epimerase (non-hydrolysing)
VKELHIVHVVGARPNFMKIAPILAACASRPGLRATLVHTGQHYDESMSRLFFEQLAIPRPDVNLDVGSGSHAQQTAAVMQRFEPVLRERRPGLVLVVGDVNSTLACSLTAVKLGIPVAHVEAGLRSFDRAMPEEINRLVTDAVAELLFVTEASAIENLAREGVDAARIHFVGNVMIDTLIAHRAAAAESDVVERLGVRAGEYAVLTLHRPANVDEPAALRGILESLANLAQRMPVVFPAHPRTRAALAEHAPLLAAGRGIRVLDPLGYLDFVRLMSDARLVLTDSGGIQEETTILGVPCVTIRENTERPVTVTHGTNRLAGTSSEGIRRTIESVLATEKKIVPPPPLWDGRAAARIADVVEAWGHRR